MGRNLLLEHEKGKYAIYSWRFSQNERGFQMKRFSSIAVVLFCLLFLGAGFVQAADLEFEVLSARMTRSIDTDLGAMNDTGIVVEVKVVNKGDEVKLWATDFGIGVSNGTEEVRISGFFISNAVSDPEDEMGFRYFQGNVIRKGTRYFKLFFTEMMNLQFLDVLNQNEISEATLYFRAPASGKFPVESLIADED